ncbi:unnamed protein product [Blepharisma stoltei]|uniref:protein-serine/threonine phosphatase n=1 Tax=Blepharisma stoltei TaxID=1481888 RepID=A0AAU9J5H3_9CILI|nr:unnamed protein product [Blepharisma stoltei]
MAEEVKANGALSAQAEELKTQGNQKFKEAHFSAAIDLYTQALELVPSAILFCNRSVAHLKLENYGYAEADATRAIECDPTYIKGYYRRGSAFFAMGKFKQAIKDLKTVCKIVPNDRDAKTKLATAQKELRAILFAECLERETPPPLNPENIIVPDSYQGLHLPDVVTESWVVNLMQEFKDQKKLHKKYVVMILLRIREILSRYTSLVYVNIPDNDEITVCGDVHGQYYDLMNIFQVNGRPNIDNPYLFNGDFVDRGSFSVEVILTLFTWKLCYPNHFHLTRGNHESKNMNKMYGFEGEVMAKYDAEVYDLFSNVFCYLPLGAVLNNKVLVVHGGLFAQDGIKLADIDNTDRVREPPESGIMCDILWSDPIKLNGRHPSKRGTSINFGPDVAHAFLNENGLDILVRSHEVKEEGYEVEANGRVITIFSAPNYCDQMGNKGAFIRFKGSEMKPKFTQFSAVPHPNIPAMNYARQFMFS